MTRETQRLFEFGPFRLDVTERLLHRNGQPVPMTAKVFDLLVLLVENHGRLVEKEVLLKSLWPDTFVEEANLSVNVSTLRRALGESPNQPVYIETVAKRGYRFIAAVTEPAPPEPLAAPAPARSWARLTGAVLLAVLALGALSYWLYDRIRGGRLPPGAEIRSIAVLPFRPLTGEAPDYLGLGMADALITKLSNLRQVTVRPTSAVAQYAGSKDPVEAARKLQVDAVLDGRIQRSEKTIRVTVQLLRVRDGGALWAGKFDDYFSNILQVQDSISEKVAEALSLQLTEMERQRMSRRPTEDTEAYRFYLQGQYYASKRTREGTQTAIEYYQKAAEKDPSYPLPYAGMAACYTIQAGVGWGSDLREKARAAATKALSLDDKLAEAHLALGEVRMRGDWDWKGAAEAFDRAIAIDRRLAAARWAKSTLLTAYGRHPEAILEMESACRLDPSSAAMRSDLAWTFYCSRRYDEAIQHSRKAIEMDPLSFTAHRELGKAYLMKGAYPEAIAELEKALELVGSRRCRELAEVGQAYAAAGRTAEARRILDELRRRRGEEPSFDYAFGVLEASLGDIDGAFAALREACRKRLARAIWMKVDPQLDPLRPDPRFAALLRELRLEP